MSEWEALGRLALAAILGGAIGLERESRNKSAGLRTHMLVTMGSAMFMVASMLLLYQVTAFGGDARVDPTRIGSTIVTGVGFLGGGIIFRTEDRVRGLTTAAGLWVASAIGLTIGAGFYVTGVGATVLTIAVLGFIGRVENMAERRRILPPDAEGEGE
jgi:putative Mg2+ transporter-C (MgtC) family protein